MNSPASSEKHADQSWAWDHNHHHHHHNSSNNNLRNSERSVGVTMSVGLERRPFGYDWGPTSTAVVLSGAGDDVDDRKPQIMSGPLMDSINQYHGHGNVNVVALNGMLSSGISHNNIMAAAAVAGNNPLANLISSGARNYGDHHVLGGIRSSSCSSSVGFPGGNGPILSGFGYCGDSREAAALEEQRQHILGMIGMDQKSIVHNMVKQEDFCTGDFPTRIGLNLGGRTYFSTEDNIINRLYKRPRAISPGSQVPRCQAEGCKADLSNAKHYHRRHKVCELHSKASTVISGGINQRFCQQCSRFHVLSEFDEGKRSCRKRLADHNRRRRKPQTNNASAANHNAEAPAAPKAVEDQDTNSGSNHSDVQPETIPRSEAQALLTGISLAPSLPLGLQNSNGQQHNQQYLQQTSPNLSRREMGMEYSRHTTEQKYTSALEIAIPWLKPADSSSEFGGSEKNSSTVQQVSESGASSSNTVQVFSSIQNLLPSVEIGSSDWMVNGGFSGSRNQHFGSADLNLQTSLDGQKVLSLLEKNGGEAAGRGQNKTQNAVEYLPQGGFHSKNGVVDGHSELSTGFSGMQSFRSLGQSMYQNIL